MSITLTRREVLQFVGGAALGALFSPIPWKILDDTAEWTQNWPWIPKAPAGDVSYLGATCTLCQSACGMRARAIGKQPISLAGTAAHPFNNGALCTMGLLAHHLRYHPQRLTQPMKFAQGSAHGTTISSGNALDELSRRIASSTAPGSVAIIDSRPGRTASSLFRTLAASPRLRYIPVGAPPLDALGAMTTAPLAPLGYDIDGASLILNFGAPLFDAWGTPRRAATQLDRRTAKDQTIIHIEGICSRSAERSTQWIAARPGSETLLALGIANVIITEQLYAPAAARSIADLAGFANFTAAFTPEAVSKATGVEPATIRTTARAFASSPSSVAIITSDSSFDAQSAVMALNVLTGAVGRTGGVALRAQLPQLPALAATAAAHTSSTAISEIPDHSLSVVIIDESLSGCTVSDAVLEKKLIANNGVIVSLSPFATPRPFAAQYVLPASVVFETLTDVPGPIDRAASSLALATALLPAPEGTMDAVQFALALAQAAGTSAPVTGTTEELVKQRIAALHASKRGTVFAPSTGAATAMTSVASADDVWSALADGGCWIDDAHAAHASVSFTLTPLFTRLAIGMPKARQVDQLVVLPFNDMKVYDGTAISPLLSKVSQESGLRLGLHQAYVNPATAGGASVAHGDTISLTTEHGTMKVQAKVDASVMPGVIFVSTAAASDAGSSVRQTSDIRLLCDKNQSGSFSPTPVSIQKVLA